jgi:integrase
MFNTIWPPLCATIDAMPVRGLDTYLVTSFGRPFTPAGFGNWFRAACDAVPGLPEGLSFHGLRKAVCRRIKGAARSHKHIQAVSGHTTSKMVDHYTVAADKKRLQHEAGQAVYESFEEQARTSDLPTPGQVLPTPPANPCKERKVK